MKQVLQDVRSGAIEVHDVPEPGPRPGWVLVAVSHSLISSGTERAVAELGSKSLLQKARARPDLVRKTLDVARTEGVGAAAAKVRGRLDRYSAFGYSLAGLVLDTGGDARLAPGAVVACVGAGYASHAETVSVPRNLVVLLPAGVETDEAAFAAPAAIALHAQRLADAGPGSVVAVVGLGLIGQLAGRLLRAAGCIAVGTDPRPDRRELFGDAAGEESFAELVDRASRGRGADAVLVCAAAADPGPVELAADVARDRARIVVVGDVALELDRRVLYEKELSLVVARSYGPGRYERGYEERGEDYPPGYVRWTEGRNVEAVVDLLAARALSFRDLVTHRFPVAEGARAYETLRDDPAALSILLEYEPGRTPGERTIRRRPVASTGRLRVAIVGAGSFATGTLVPELRKLDGVEIAAVCARTGAGAASLGERLDVPVVSTDWREVVADEAVDAVVVATPHAEHAEIAAAALAAGKATFVEKPLAVDREGLRQVAVAAAGRGVLLVGHNRRFAPLAARLRAAVEPPLLVQIRVAAAPLPEGHWLTDPAQGGRVLGEISHFVDLAAFLARALPAEAFAASVPLGGGEESLAATIRFSNGSAAAIAYGVGESSGLAKERVEVLGAGAAAVLDDFTRLELHGRRSEKVKSRRDKGHQAQLEAFVRAARGEADPPVAVEEQLLVAAASLALVESARTGAPVGVELPG